MAAAEAKSAAQDRARANAAAAAAAAASADELNDSDDDNDFMTGFGAIEDVNTEYEYAMAEAGGRWKPHACFATTRNPLGKRADAVLVLSSGGSTPLASLESSSRGR